MVSFGRAIFLGLIGARVYLENITRSDITTLSKSLSLVSGNNVTMVLLVSAVTFGFLPYYPRFEIAAYPLIGVNFLRATLFILLGLRNHKTRLKLPGAYLRPMAAFLALLAARLRDAASRRVCPCGRAGQSRNELACGPDRRSSRPKL